MGFDSPADIAGMFGDNSGILSGASTPELDASISASGASSIKFTIPSNSPADSSGSFFINFSNDLATQFGENAELYVQWRQRFSPEFLGTFFDGGGGWKQAIIGAGDKPGCTAATSASGLCSSSCTALETVVQNTFQRGFAQMYNSCTGSTSHKNGFDPFDEVFGSFDFKLQNARPNPFCLYSQANTIPPTSFPSTGNCIGYFPNEWMTFQVRIKTGPRVNDVWTNSYVTLWIAREGQPSQLAIDWGPYDLAAGSASDDWKFGKIWLLPYDTGKDPSQKHATGFTWYDELIISRAQIADPQSPTPTPSAPPPLANTVLANLAKSIAPGTWAQLNAANQDAVLGVGDVSGTMIHFSNTMPWNPFSKVIEIVGMDHNWGMQRHVRYDEASNSFVVAAADDGLGTQTQHGYDHNAVNPFTGDLYHRVFSLTGTISSRRKLLNTSNFVDIPSVMATEQVAIGATWWSGAFTGGGGGGAQGSFMLFNSGNALGIPNDGQILAYNPLTNAWFFNQQAMAPNYGSGETYHSVMEYSSIKNVAVYGGGNVAAKKLWRLNQDGSFTVMPDVPDGKGAGIQQGLLVNDPVSGNFLLLSAGELWELDPSGLGTWTQQTGSRVPPSGVGVPGPVFPPDAVIASAIPDYGVVAFITQSGHTGGTFFLYKHR